METGHSDKRIHVGHEHPTQEPKKMATRSRQLAVGRRTMIRLPAVGGPHCGEVIPGNASHAAIENDKFRTVCVYLFDEYRGQKRYLFDQYNSEHQTIKKYGKINPPTKEKE